MDNIPLNFDSRGHDYLEDKLAQDGQKNLRLSDVELVETGKTCPGLTKLILFLAKIGLISEQTAINNFKSKAVRKIEAQNYKFAVETLGFEKKQAKRLVKSGLVGEGVILGRYTIQNKSKSNDGLKRLKRLKNLDQLIQMQKAKPDAQLFNDRIQWDQLKGELEQKKVKSISDLNAESFNQIANDITIVNHWHKILKYKEKLNNDERFNAILDRVGGQKNLLDYTAEEVREIKQLVQLRIAIGQREMEMDKLMTLHQVAKHSGEDYTVYLAQIQNFIGSARFTEDLEHIEEVKAGLTQFEGEFLQQLSHLIKNPPVDLEAQRKVFIRGVNQKWIEGIQQNFPSLATLIKSHAKYQTLTQDNYLYRVPDELRDIADNILLLNHQQKRAQTLNRGDEFARFLEGVNLDNLEEKVTEIAGNWDTREFKRDVDAAEQHIGTPLADLFRKHYLQNGKFDPKMRFEEFTTFLNLILIKLQGLNNALRPHHLAITVEERDAFFGDLQTIDQLTEALNRLEEAKIAQLEAARYKEGLDYFEQRLPSFAARLKAAHGDQVFDGASEEFNVFIGKLNRAKDRIGQIENRIGAFEMNPREFIWKHAPRAEGELTWDWMEEQIARIETELKAMEDLKAAIAPELPAPQFGQQAINFINRNNLSIGQLDAPEFKQLLIAPINQEKFAAIARQFGQEFSECLKAYFAEVQPNIMNGTERISEDGLARVMGDPYTFIVPQLEKRHPELNARLTQDIFSEIREAGQFEILFKETQHLNNWIDHLGKSELAKSLVIALGPKWLYKFNPGHKDIQNVFEYAEHLEIYAPQDVASAVRYRFDQLEADKNAQYALEEMGKLDWGQHFWIKDGEKALYRACLIATAKGAVAKDDLLAQEAVMNFFEKWKGLDHLPVKATTVQYIKAMAGALEKYRKIKKDEATSVSLADEFQVMVDKQVLVLSVEEADKGIDAARAEAKLKAILENFVKGNAKSYGDVVKNLKDAPKAALIALLENLLNKLSDNQQRAQVNQILDQFEEALGDNFDSWEKIFALFGAEEFGGKAINEVGTLAAGFLRLLKIDPTSDDQLIQLNGFCQNYIQTAHKEFALVGDLNTLPNHDNLLISGLLANVLSLFEKVKTRQFTAENPLLTKQGIAQFRELLPEIIDGLDYAFDKEGNLNGAAKLGLMFLKGNLAYWIAEKFLPKLLTRQPPKPLKEMRSDERAKWDTYLAESREVRASREKLLLAVIPVIKNMIQQLNFEDPKVQKFLKEGVLLMRELNAEVKAHETPMKSRELSNRLFNVVSALADLTLTNGGVLIESLEAIAYIK